MALVCGQSTDTMQASFRQKTTLCNNGGGDESSILNSRINPLVHLTTTPEQKQWGRKRQVQSSVWLKMIKTTRTTQQWLLHRHIFTLLKWKHTFCQATCQCAALKTHDRWWKAVGGSGGRAGSSTHPQVGSSVPKSICPRISVSLPQSRTLCCWCVWPDEESQAVKCSW